MKSEVIYKRDSKGRIRSWQYEVQGGKFRTLAGLVDGKITVSAWTICEGKNIGRSNETTPDSQAATEGLAELHKNLDREYRRTVDELDGVPTSPMLAKDYGKLKKPVDFPVFSQPKLDGIRATMSIRGAFTREYQPHHNVKHLLPLLEGAIDKYGVEFDGELYNHDLKADFSKIQRLVRKESLSADEQAEVERVLQYHVYDLPGAAPFKERSAQLQAIVEEINHPMIVFVPTVEVRTQEDLDALGGHYIENGYEGQMVRLNEPYDFDTRSSSLLKRKEFITEEFPFIRVEEGNGNWAGYAKRVVYQMKDGSEGKAGLRGNQGFAKELLTKIFKSNTEVTIRHFGLMSTGGHRFPVAIDFHDGGRKD